MKKIKESLQKLCDTVKINNIHIMGILKGEEKEKGTEGIFKTIMAENFYNLGKEMDIHIYEVPKTPNRLNLNRVTPRHIIN